tara:strand:+ start:2939 stop:3325 length:387 start_codon:yes stop_codon:yes gene_type:complete
MGRYYNGDINGKFWFAVQSSHAPSRFGGDIYEPQETHYEFREEEHREQVETELSKIKEKLGPRLLLLEKFFRDNNGYNNDMIEDLYTEEGISATYVEADLVDYADYGLGKKILACIVENGECNFVAEW